jgi:hypothetical protein
MTSVADLREMRPRIIVFGVGGGGGNAINNMIAAGLEGVDLSSPTPTHRRSPRPRPRAPSRWVSRSPKASAPARSPK